MKSFNKSNFVSLSVIFFGLILVTGCAWWPFSKSDHVGESSSSGGDVLLTINGKPALTVREYEEKLEMARQSNPQIDMLLSMMPNAEKDFIFRSIATAELMKAWAHKNGIDQTDAFQKQRQQVHEAMDLQLYMKAFDDAHPVQISDQDVAKFYEEQKDLIPALTLQAGGVDVTFVRFENKAAADSFYAKTKEVRKAETFKTLAEEQKEQVGSAMINQNSQFVDAVKNAILDISKFPSVHMIKTPDNAYWIVFAAGKSKAQYRELNNPEVQAGLKKMLIEQRKEKQLEALVEKLKEELNVVEHNSYFEEKARQKQAGMQAMNQEESEEDEQQVPVKV